MVMRQKVRRHPTMEGARHELPLTNHHASQSHASSEALARRSDVRAAQEPELIGRAIASCVKSLRKGRAVPSIQILWAGLTVDQLRGRG
jgi:hypothetical protein